MSKLSEEDAKFLYVNGFKPSNVMPPNWFRQWGAGTATGLRFSNGSWSLSTYTLDGEVTDCPFTADNPVKLVIWAKLEGLL